MKRPYSENTFSIRTGKWCHIRELKFRLWLSNIKLAYNNLKVAYWEWRLARALSSGSDTSTDTPAKNDTNIGNTDK